MYHIAICDDSMEFITYIGKMLNEIKEDKDIMLYEYMSGEELVRNLDKGIRFDLLILDMELGGMDGDETAELFRKVFPYAVLVFCSGVRQPTTKSFRATPFRYMLKQQSKHEHLETMREVMEEVERNADDPTMMAHYGRTMVNIKVRNVLYIENSKRGGRVVVCPGCKEAKYKEKLLVDEKPRQLLENYGRYGFALSQSSCLVNMNHIEILHSDDFQLDNGEIITIARAYQKSFREAFARRFANKYHDK